ncbi:MAG: HD domain-containing protein [Lachnospiraceae bacterium]|nr:HD domain-containing protein [Lachnospiraceae bacterium]
MKALERLLKNKNLAALYVCLIGIMLNMVLSSITSAFGLPLYLDTVGTVAVAIMGGFLPGVVVGFVTNLLKTITEPASLYYGVLNVLIALFAALFAQKGAHKKVRGVIGMIAVFTLIGGGIGALIPWFMEGLSFDSESLSGVLYGTGLFGLGTSHLLSSIIMDLPDKILTVLIALGIIRIIPRKYYDLVSLNMWMQTPENGDENAKGGKTNVRVVSLRIKTLVVLVLSMTTVALICTFISVRVFRKMTINEHTQLAQGTADLAASVINGDMVDGYLRSGGITDEYSNTKRRLEKILFSSEEISYLYVYKVEENGYRVVFDIDTEGSPAEKIGTVNEYEEGFIPLLPRLKAGKSVKPITTNDEYGNLLTAFAPVYNSMGKCVCYAIADVDMNKLNADGLSFLTEMISVFLGFFILLCTFTIWLTEYQMIMPINSIARSMDILAHTDESQKSMDEDVKMFRRLGIHTGDEIEELYRSACSMTKNQAEQMRSIRRLSESTAKLQEGLIITMADMVENRDSDTGAHVQKTAAYVKVIVEGLKKKGYYVNKITPEFISNVVRSAPLHDIGKINIPDEVLNKRGKLTPEEYDIMKTHTTAGKNILEHAISTVEGENYLKEARNMAAYHHERWDGKGYPEGMHGEVIPLSARIMAVADVFDALSSPRVYKPAFSLEKSLAIIEEGRGTQFDPKCVEVFMDSLSEVKEILKKYNGDVEGIS